VPEGPNGRVLLSSDAGMPVAARTTAMLWSEIIFPITPAAALVAAVNNGFRPSVSAVITQVAEQGIGRGVRCGHKDPKPAKKRAEEREAPARGGECQPERGESKPV